jgi:hypothetical protein
MTSPAKPPTCRTSDTSSSLLRDLHKDLAKLHQVRDAIFATLVTGVVDPSRAFRHIPLVRTVQSVCGHDKLRVLISMIPTEIHNQAESNHCFVFRFVNNVLVLIKLVHTRLHDEMKTTVSRYHIPRLQSRDGRLEGLSTHREKPPSEKDICTSSLLLINTYVLVRKSLNRYCMHMPNTSAIVLIYAFVQIIVHACMPVPISQVKEHFDGSTEPRHDPSLANLLAFGSDGERVHGA